MSTTPEPGKVTADPAHVDPTEDGWFSSPGSDILRRPSYNDKGEFVGYQEILPSIWPKPRMTDERRKR